MGDMDQDPTIPKDTKSQSPPNSLVTTRFGDINTTSQVMPIDSRTTTPTFMALMIWPGDQMVTETQPPTRTIPTTGMTRVMDLSATLAEVTDVLSVEDMDTSTLEPSGDTTDTALESHSELVTTTLTPETSQDLHTTSTDTESVDATPRDGQTDMEADTDSDTERDTVLPTDGPCTTDMERVTHHPRDLLWDMVLVLTLLSRTLQVTDTENTEHDHRLANVQY